MILINLLPQESRFKEIKHLNIPYKQILSVATIFLLLITIYHVFVFFRVRSEHGKVQKEWAGLAEKSAQADMLERELGDTITAEVDFYDTMVDPTLETAHVMNLVGDLIPKSVWLTDLKFERKKKNFELVLIGISDAGERGSKLIDIQNFANSLKIEMEKVLLQSVQGVSGLTNRIKVAVTTSSQRTDENTEVTQFTATLKMETPEVKK